MQSILAVENFPTLDDSKSIEAQSKQKKKEKLKDLEKEAIENTEEIIKKRQ